MDLLELGISLILTIFVYLIFPICYRYGNGKVCEKDAKKMALWNSIICAAIFCVIRGIISGGETVVTSFAPAFLYYFIAKSILVDYNMKETIKEKNKKELEQSDDAYICSKCGMQVFSDEEKCSNCGATNIHFNKSCNGKENDNAKIVPEEIVEEEVVIANDNNTKLSNNKSNSNRINIIKNLQKAVTIVACVLVLFAIIYPISTTAIKNGKIPNYNEYKTTQLTRLDANQKVYCDYLEHLLLHILICENPSADQNAFEAVGIGGVVNFIVPELNDFYSGWITSQQWRKNCHERIQNDKDVYMILLKRFKYSCKNYPFYTNDCLFTSFNEDFGLWSKEQNKQLFEEIKNL